MKITIRNALEKDAEQLTEIAITSKKYWNYPDAWYEAWGDMLVITAEIIRDYNIWVAEHDSKPIGFIAISVQHDVAELEHMWVLPSFIKKGIGKTLFNKVVGYCQSNAVKQIRIESDPNAAAFYEKMGARRVGYVESKPKPRQLPVLILDVTVS